MMLFSPETFANIVQKALDVVRNIITAIEQLFSGDISGFFETFKENMLSFSLIIGGILLYFGPALIGAAMSVINAVKTVSLFMRATAFPAIASFFTSMFSSVSAMLVPMLPAIAIGAGIVLVLGGLLYGFNKLKESLGPGASIMDTLKVAALYLVDFLSMLVNGITFVPRKIIGFLGARAAKWLFGDDFYTSALDAISQGLRTDRGATAAAEIKEKNEKAAAEAEAQKQLEEQRKKDMAENQGGEILGTSTENALAGIDMSQFEQPQPQFNNINTSSLNQQNASVTVVSDRPSRVTQNLLAYSR